MRNLVVTACGDVYLDACETLIASIHRTSLYSVDCVYVYDLGLSNSNVARLKACLNVTVMNFPADLERSVGTWYLDPTQYGYKCFALHAAGQYAEYVLWLDAGAALLKDAATVFDLIESHDIFMVEDPTQKNAYWTHEDCRRIMQVTPGELSANQIWSGILGYKVNGRYQALIEEALRWSQIREVLVGSRANHRHDQTILSILALRYQCPMQDIRVFGEWRGMDRHRDQVVYAHRRGYINKSGLIRVRKPFRTAEAASKADARSSQVLEDAGKGTVRESDHASCSLSWNDPGRVPHVD